MGFVTSMVVVGAPFYCAEGAVFEPPKLPFLDALYLSIHRVPG